jgi:cell wall-associated NlpC family hydrolase
MVLPERTDAVEEGSAVRVVSLRRPGSRSRRSLLRGLPVVLAALLALTLGVAPAAAQPRDAAGAAAELEKAQREAEALTEQWHEARDELQARETELETLRAAVEPARAAVEAARTNEDEYRDQVDAVLMTTFESGRLDQFNALLASRSPQDYLDQMSALETLYAEHKTMLDELLVRVEDTARAQADADAAAERAQLAADEADRAAAEIEERKREAEIRIDEAERLLERLTPRERAERAGPDVAAPSGPVTGSGVGVRALEIAATQLGKPYRWGADGPDSYDCSGLTSWAFRQAGVTLPRSSRQQAQVGSAVSWDAMRPGDLVFYYSPVSHVGIYAGEGKMINAPQTGDVVRYQTVSSSAFSGARRL